MEKQDYLSPKIPKDPDTGEDLEYLRNNQIDKIYNKYCNSLYLFGQSLTSDSNVVEDAIQELFVWLLNNSQKVQIHTSLKLYLFKSYRHLILSILKKARIISIRETDLSHVSNKLTEFTDIHEHLDMEETMMTKMKAAIVQLSSRQYEMIMLKYIHDYSYEQIAKIMEISVESAYNLNHRSIQKLKDLVL